MSIEVDYTQPDPDHRPLLNWFQAKELLDAGFAIELPEFRGWWFKKENKIHVRTRDGKLLSSPWIETYKSREDWRVSMQTMDFSQAVRFAQEGNPVKRRDRVSNGPRNQTFFALLKVDTHFPCTVKDIVSSYQAHNEPFFLEDIVSEDWRMLNLDALVPGEE